MEISTAELNILQTLANAEADRGAYMSIDKLCSELSGTRKAVSPSDVLQDLRRLRQKSFVAFDGGDAIEITDTGLAALKSM
ncbi:hypothetical protein [Pseudorhodoplanes sp.]|uniref:hypothetical protein n=1 Tax=Pseudorhodoplanes sp. TaxID=1934341 RepID=UPI003D0CFF61